MGPIKRAQLNVALTGLVFPPQLGGKRGMCVNIRELSDLTILSSLTSFMGTWQGPKKSNTESTNEKQTLPPASTNTYLRAVMFSQLEVL